MKNIKLQSKQTGFTLMELAITIAIIAVLAAVFLPGLLQNQEDAKASSALTQLQKDFPSAISRQISRTNVCNGTTMTKANLESRGMQPNGVFGDSWTVSYAANVVTVTYPVTGASDAATVATDLRTAMANSNNVASVGGTGNNVVIGYRCN